MKNKNKITVWQNGKQVKVRRLAHEESKVNPNIKKGSFIARIFNKKSRKRSFNQRKFHLKEYKHVILAFFSAIIIGLLLGFTMLNMMTNIKNPSAISTDVNNQGTTSNNAVSSAPSQVIVNEMNAFVVQAGVFSEKSNALEWSAKFSEANFPAVIWEREKQFFLLVGLTNTIEEATELLNELKQYGFDIFIKEWSTSAIKLDMTPEEHAWLKAFQTEWTETLRAINKESGLSVDDWQQIMASHPFEKERMSGLVDIMEVNFDEDNGEEVNERTSQMVLLTMWERYDHIFK